MTRPHNLPLTVECGSDAAKGYPSTIEIITQGRRAWLGKRATVQVVHRSPGYRVAGSAMRWTNGGYSLRWTGDGETTSHGGHYGDNDKARRDALHAFQMVADDVTMPALAPHEGSWIIKGKDSGEVACELFRADSLKVSKVDCERFEIVPIATHLASLSTRKDTA